MADLRFREQLIRVLSWYLPPGRRNEVMTFMSQAMPNHGPPLFAGGDFNYNVLAPAAEEHDRAQQVRGFLAQRSSMCVEFPGPTHRPTEQSDRSTRQLDAFAVPASAKWKWAVTPCWTDGQSDHAAIVASLHRRRTADSGVMSPHLVKNLPSSALNDLRSRFGLLERFLGIPNRPCVHGLLPNTYNRPRGSGVLPGDTILEDNRGASREGEVRPDPVHEGDHPRNADSFRQDSNNDQAPPLLLGLLNHGRTAMEAMIQGWWRT